MNGKGKPAAPSAGKPASPSIASASTSSQPPHSSGRRLCLFFDGTGNAAFLEKITNLPTGFGLACNEPDKQLLYYQTGIGTTSLTLSTGLMPSVLSRLWARISAVVDEGVAYSLPAHIQRGYQFLMNYWQPGDQIYLFGFSRGAYTARALAGMLQRVGLLPAGNEETIPLAYEIYKGDKDLAEGLEKESAAQAFKRTFSREVEVHFVGVWDTVSSVGALIPRTLPFANGSSFIRHFRQALALDEHRARFAYQPWIASDEPMPADFSIKQVWFAGAHSNIGGGLFGYDGDRDPALSHLTLRWMLREAVEAGMWLNEEHLAASPIFAPFVEAADRAVAAGNDPALEAYLAKVAKSNPDMPPQTAALVFLAASKCSATQDDAFAPRGDSLSFHIQEYPPEVKKKRGFGGRLEDWWSRQMQRIGAAAWWALEISPTLKIYWDIEGNQRTWTLRWNRGRGRVLLPDPTFHFSVAERLAASPATLLEHSGGNNENVPETKGYHFKAQFLPGQSMKNVTFVD